MYSGTTLTKYSGRVLGSHQKLDVLSRRQLEKLGINRDQFPSIRKILHFEGKNGPDGIKRKSPAVDEPWHYFNPFDDKDSDLIDLIETHYKRLVKDLKAKDEEKAAFEAAWLAHALVDGLTPAHHFPYEQKIAELRGEDNSTRNTIKEKLLVARGTALEKARGNWKMWGPKGIITSHSMFELGLVMLVKPLKFSESIPSDRMIKDFKELGIAEWYKRVAREIAVLGMFDHYLDRGWTPKLAWQVRHKLVPAIVQTITLSWHSAVHDAQK